MHYILIERCAVFDDDHEMLNGKSFQDAANAQDVFAQEGYKKVIFVWKSSVKRGI